LLGAVKDAASHRIQIKKTAFGRFFVDAEAARFYAEAARFYAEAARFYAEAARFYAEAARPTPRKPSRSKAL
jgi:hypothetical protein